MITTELINERFIQQTVAKGSKKIFDVQSDVASKYLTSQSGRLQHLITSRKYQIDGTRFKYPTLTYMRFLEINSKNTKRAKEQRSGIAIYNRVIWGVLYREVMPGLRYGLTSDIRKQIHNQLLAAVADKQQLQIQFPE